MSELMYQVFPREIVFNLQFKNFNLIFSMKLFYFNLFIYLIFFDKLGFPF